jgi:hypothetical protein
MHRFSPCASVHGVYDHQDMVYCVVPKPLESELFAKLSAHYEGDENVEVIVDRRAFDRRARRASIAAADDGKAGDQRLVRDRRRARVSGDLPPLAQAAS